MDTSIVIVSGTNGKIQRSITHINPAATAEQLVTFSKALNGLTNNEYGQTNRIQKINVDTEEIPSSVVKKTATLTLNPTTFTAAQIGRGEGIVTITAAVSDYDGDPLITLTNEYFPTIKRNPDRIDIGYDSGNTPPVVLKVMIPETDEYYAATATITITE